ncbi:MAG: fluoride efflux transporter CrcB [Lautropia sp.]
MSGTLPPAGLSAFAAIAVGAACGAWLRWGLGLWLNGVHASISVGTWVANVAGGLLVGAGFAWFSRHPEVDALWRLMLMTGFLGALTTFSTFSLESLQLIQRGAYGWVFLHAGLHLFGSLAAAALGYRWFAQA